MAIVVPWNTAILTVTDKIVIAPQERFLAIGAFGIEVMLFSVYVLLGGVYELLRKARAAANLFLEIKKLEASHLAAGSHGATAVRGQQRFGVAGHCGATPSRGSPPRSTTVAG